MPRKRKTDIKLNDDTSLEYLMQEIYNDGCLQIMESQKTITELSNSVPSKDLDVDDLTKIAKEKGNLLKVKESGIRLKLEIARLQTDIIKNRGGNGEGDTNQKSNSVAPSPEALKQLREALIQDRKDKANNQ